jgi:hypothetical protein
LELALMEGGEWGNSFQHGYRRNSRREAVVGSFF